MDIKIRLAQSEDATAITTMLRQLADDIGDSDIFSCDVEAILRHGFGEKPILQSLIAEADGRNLGLALFFPIFSTTRGKSGVYVQDLWVAEEARGKGLGVSLLAAAIKHAAHEWKADFLKLTVYADNSTAAQFYQRLGFEGDDRERPVALEGAAFTKLRDQV
ncbi:MAG: GNAT family N-acetyltransferase [Rhodospirillaceae bacterium]|nr:GNAT family N-acetyltransferase [Rhodospirillaceae bacterium]MBL6931174.1 GNAT family N-acetyltransferase [Rhodospirillales bacterium]